MSTVRVRARKVCTCGRGVARSGRARCRVWRRPHSNCNQARFSHGRAGRDVGGQGRTRTRAGMAISCDDTADMMELVAVSVVEAKSGGGGRLAVSSVSWERNATTELRESDLDAVHGSLTYRSLFSMRQTHLDSNAYRVFTTLLSRNAGQRRTCSCQAQACLDPKQESEDQDGVERSIQKRCAQSCPQP
nr:hypothetical protein CFP56_00838 [Quercus suber]